MICLANILIVEDDLDIHNVLEEILKKAGFTYSHVYSGSEAMLLLEKNKYDLILLDLMLPALSGEKIISQVSDTPIIVISAKISPSDKVNALSLGANDYLTKPFNKDELLARINVQLRNSKPLNKDLSYKDLKLLNDNRTLLIGENKINLTKTEYAILKHLIINQKEVVPKNKLLDLISNDTLDGDENSLKVHISNIRKKLKKYSKNNYIESIWGIGFKMS